MYRAVYKFVGGDPGTLSFDVDDKFLVIDKSSAWWLVSNCKGKTGYVPSNYLTPEKASGHEVLMSIDRAIEMIHQKTSISGGDLTEDQLHKLRILQTHRNDTIQQYQLKESSLCNDGFQMTESISSEKGKVELRTRRQAPLPPCSSGALSVIHVNSHPKAAIKDSKVEGNSSSVEDNQNVKVHCEVQNLVGHGSNTSDKLSEEFFIRAEESEASLDGFGIELVEQMRRNTLLSYNKSKVAVNTVLKMLSNRIPAFKGVIDRIMDDVTREQSLKLGESCDASRLRCILEELVAAKDDSQQRSWFLHEDEGKICSHLEELNSILEGANPQTSCKVLEEDGYSASHSLALYYQMETRRSIRLLLLQSFGSMCGLDSRFLSELLNSVLPLELARDIQNDPNDKQKIMYSALVLSMMLSTGETLPLQYYVHLNMNFINFLLDNIETPAKEVESEQIADGFMRLILAFNLHFELPEENIVMKVFAERGTAKTFTEKLLLMLNREDDPVKLFEFSSHCPNSVLKFVSDLYSCPKTSGLFYTNDAKVLIDIIVRQLTDMSPGDKMRTEYLSLLHLLLKNSEYFEHRHRQTELQRCLQRISLEDKEAEMDKHVVRQIWKEFPSEFYNCV